MTIFEHYCFFLSLSLSFVFSVYSSSRDPVDSFLRLFFSAASTSIVLAEEEEDVFSSSSSSSSPPPPPAATSSSISGREATGMVTALPVKTESRSKFRDFSLSFCGSPSAPSGIGIDRSFAGE